VSAQDDIAAALRTQLDETLAVLARVSEDKSLHRYAPGKWSLRELLGHVVDAERIFLYRALWFARGLPGDLAGFDETVASAGAQADATPWAGHVEEFRAVRQSTVLFFRHLPAEAWTRRGTASENPVTVRALAYIIAGHAAHHFAVMQERYL
jgi:uncharacterized damage-inducible protein DinB